MKKTITILVFLLLALAGYGQLLAPNGIKYRGTLLTPTAAQFNYVYGVTSAIQTQFTGKVGTADTATMLTKYSRKASPTFTGIVSLPVGTAIGDVSATELQYVNGVTSAIQTQFTGKVGTADTATMLSKYSHKASPTFTGTVVLPAATSISTVTSTEIGYLDNVTSAIQTQLDAKVKLLPDSVQHTANFTLAASDVGKDMYCTENGPQVITIPLNFSDMSISSTLNFYGSGTGPMIFKGASGVHIFSRNDSIASGGAGDVIGMKKRGANNYWIYGNLQD